MNKTPPPLLNVVVVVVQYTALTTTRIQLRQHVLNKSLRIPDRHAPPGELGRAVEDEVQGPGLAQPNTLCLSLLCCMHEERALAAGEPFEAEMVVVTTTTTS